MNVKFTLWNAEKEIYIKKNVQKKMYKIKAIYIETISIHYVYINETDNVFMNIFFKWCF